tara:strand:- start:1265 stop:2725 length:1461 start_codon:yes stop_codon:yes gene_type:complete
VTENIFKTAVLHHSKGNFSKAKEIYESLLKTSPNNLAVLQNYGTLLSQIKEYKKAEDVFEKCLKIKPDDHLLLYNYGKCFHDQKIFEKAIKFYKQSFSIEPKKNLSMYNIGNIYFSKGEFENAISAFKKSIEVNPENFLAHNNLGLSYKNIRNFDAALKSHKNAIEKNKDYVDGHVNYGTQLLMLEQFQEGFREYEWRKKSKSFSDYVNYTKLNLKSKLWEGQNLNNKRLLVIAEQGIGDLIQFSRYLFLIKKKYNVEIILYIKSKKFSHFFDQKKFKIVSQGDKIPNHDYHNHMISLLKFFLKENNLFCKPVNLFQKNEKAEKKWNERIEKYTGIKIGINSLTSHLVRKNIPMKYFFKLASNFDCNFIVMQKEVKEDELKEISKKKNILYFPDTDSSEQAFVDSIEIIKHLDLVITADTAMAHLSATMGKKTWILLPFLADWRWFLDESNSKWYENVTLFRSKKIDNWDSPFKTIEGDLKTIVTS